MAKIKGGLCPWDLTVQIGGQDVATHRPTWAGVQRLQEMEQALADPKRMPGLEKDLRSAVGLFVPEHAGGLVEAAHYDELLEVFAEAAAYFGVWLKKKLDSARRAGLEAAGAAVQAPPLAAGKQQPTPSR